MDDFEIVRETLEVNRDSSPGQMETDALAALGGIKAEVERLQAEYHDALAVLEEIAQMDPHDSRRYAETVAEEFLRDRNALKGGGE
jgi:hypothetical protein